MQTELLRITTQWFKSFWRQPNGTLGLEPCWLSLVSDSYHADALFFASQSYFPVLHVHLFVSNRNPSLE